MTNDNKMSLGAHNVSNERQQRLEAEYRYGSWENYGAKLALLDAEKDLRRSYDEVAREVTDEETLAEAMEYRTPYWMNAVVLSMLDLPLLGAPEGSKEWTEIANKVDGRTKRLPAGPHEGVPAPFYADYTETGWPRNCGTPVRYVTPEEHREIERRLKSGRLTKPGSNVANVGQTLAEMMAEDIPQAPWIIEGLLREGGAMMAYGPSGVGKTWFVHTLMLLASHGSEAGIWDPEGERWVVKAGNHEGLRVALVDGEMTRADIVERDTVLCKALGLESDIASPGGASIDLSNIEIYAKSAQDPGATFVDLADPEWRQTIISYVKATETRVVIFDNLSTLCPSLEDENAAAEWAPLNDLVVSLKREGVASILVHHAGKGGRYRGSSNLVTTLETVVNLQAVEGHEGAAVGDARFRVLIEKARAHGVPQVHDKVLRLSGGKWIIEVDEHAMTDRVVRMIKSLRFGSQKELGETLGMTPMQIGRAIAVAVASGKAKKDDLNASFRKAKELRSDPSVFFPTEEATEGALDI